MKSVRHLKMWVGVGVLAAGLAAAGSVVAAQGPGGPGGRVGPGGPAGVMGLLRPFGIVAQRLGLSDAQKAQIKAVAQAHQPELQALFTNRQVAQQALRTAQLGTQPDGTIRQLHANLAAVEGDLAVAEAHLLADVMQVLTPDQQATLRSMQAKMQQRASQMLQRMQQQRRR